MSTSALPLSNPASIAVDDPALLAPFTSWEGGDAVSALQLSGLHCAACAGIIERALLAQPGVTGASVHAAASRLKLRWRPEQARLADLVAAVEHAGYGAVPDVAAEARRLRQREQRQALWRLFVAGFMMMQVMMLATPVYVAAPGEMAPDQQRLLQWGQWVLSLPVLMFSASPFFKSAWLQLRSRQLGMDVPVVLGLVVAFVASSAASFDPGGLFGHEVYFDSLTMFVSFLLAGRYLELRWRHKAAEQLEQSVQALPELAERIDEQGRSEQVHPSRLRVGDLLRVAAGQAFAADGRVQSGHSAVNEALLSGESLPVAKAMGDEVVAGSLNLDAPLLVRVERVGGDTRYEAIVRLMREALVQRPGSLAFAERMARPFLWTVLLLAAGAAAWWSWWDPSRAVWVAVSVLIVTCPCALSLAAPAARVAATAALARRGLLLRRAELLETLAEVDLLVLDKTGTLTEGQLVLGRHWLAPGANPGLPAMAAALAAQSRHPLSQALRRACPETTFDWRDVREQAGQGLEAMDADGRSWRLGSQAWVGQGVDPSQGLAQLAFGCEGRVLLWFLFDERMRADAAAALAAWHEAGLDSLLLSGDSPARADRVAAAAGVQRCIAGASPERKLAVVAELQAAGRKVLMVGDGINDAPVLARADASIVMAEGAMLARAQADGVLLVNRLAELPRARALALAMRRIVKQNLAWAALYNLACVPLALAGLLPPWAAGLGMALSSLLVVANALRLNR
ncbi:cation-translocating P-type ATPase [Pelomonas sp. SE-A7]|uniref:heavy metal translocating P-type ATPase n=1 Tax=Pelomonas sp. SE-A7 TaxID=3054953 RepID=UPI00259CF9D9|nr:cation-translocating P-type ATPase [Pelomonas sp. SE-A7]MDM4765736.1 cation-translocating P-type ATPase [Pelomonas sp. SE-A7]